MKRIQRQRTKGWRMPEGAVYVGRPSLWGNPYTVAEMGSVWSVPAPERAAAAVAMYRRELQHWGLLSDYAAISEPKWRLVCDDVVRLGAHNMAEYAPYVLRGLDLACWCPLDAPCHADVLLEIANGAA